MIRRPSQHYFYFNLLQPQEITVFKKSYEKLNNNAIFSCCNCFALQQHCEWEYLCVGWILFNECRLCTKQHLRNPESIFQPVRTTTTSQHLSSWLPTVQHKYFAVLPVQCLYRYKLFIQSVHSYSMHLSIRLSYWVYNHSTFFGAIIFKSTNNKSFRDSLKVSFRGSLESSFSCTKFTTITWSYFFSFFCSIICS